MAASRRSRFVVAFATLAVASMVAVGCGQQGDDDDSGDSDSSESGPKVGLVTDVGGLNDRSFNAQANAGFERAEEELDATGSVIESKSDSDYQRNLGSQVTNGSDVIIGIGFLMGDAVKEAAGKAPDSNFAIVDYSYVGESGEWEGPDNVASLMFKEQEAGYLAGVVAGAAEEAGELEGLNEEKVVSAVGGLEIPPVIKFIAGFKAGVESQCADCEVLVDYSQDFVDQAKCQDRANAQIARGSDIVFQVAGGCGLGALDAAKTKGVWGIGVDADQAYLGDHILTSAVKRVDEAVFRVIEEVGNDDFAGGEEHVFGLEEDGVGVGEIAEPAQQYEELVDEARQQIIDGEIEVPDSL